MPFTSSPARRFAAFALAFIAAASMSGQPLPEAASGTAYSALAPSEIADLLEQELTAVRSPEGQSATRLQELLDELASRKVPNDPPGRAEMAKAWKAAAVVIRETEGASPLHLAALEIAVDLDPGDRWLAKELAFQKRRQEILQARVERAAQARAETGAAGARD